MRIIVLVGWLSAHVAFAQLQAIGTNAVLTSNAVPSALGSQSRRSGNPPAAVQTTQRFWPETFKDWIAVLQSLAVIMASAVAVYGINSWRRELLGKRRMELAEEVLALFYQAKDIIALDRFPAGYADEGDARKAEPHEKPEQKRTRDDASVTRERFNKNSEAFSRIHALRYRFMAQFGKDTGVPFDQLKSILDELFVALHQWVMLSEVDDRVFTTSQSRQDHQARIEKYEAVLWGMEEDDQISMRVEKAIAHVEQICRPHIDRKR